MFEGAYSDDDTDIEFVTLHAVEKYGLDLTHAEITEMWKKHINRKIWVANRTARNLMDKGVVAPETGSKENNHNWFQIDPQLVNEIWSAFYPGMTKKAAARAEWGARITNDDWGTHPTIAYGAMYSGAFFEKDVEKLVVMAVEAVPNEGPFAEGLRDVVQWHKQYPDWRDTRKRIHEKYYRYEKGPYKAPVSIVSSLQNGLCGIMAILYGQGDFKKTVGIAVRRLRLRQPGCYLRRIDLATTHYGSWVVHVLLLPASFLASNGAAKPGIRRGQQDRLPFLNKRPQRPVAQGAVAQVAVAPRAGRDEQRRGSIRSCYGHTSQKATAR
jgi:hypothetical protein